MKVHLVDGTYELFRHFFAVPPHRTGNGEEVAATRGVMSSLAGLLAAGATHVGVATDHVIESWRNERWPGYKSSAGVDRVLLGQFGLLEEALSAMGLVVWPMVEWEADDALASAAETCAADSSVEQVVICTPDKDLGQCVRDGRVVQLDRRRNLILDEAGVTAKFGVAPESIPDWLALVGDSADGYPGLPGWGAKSASAVLHRYVHLEDVPALGHQWEVDVRGARTLAATLSAERDKALLFKELATLLTEPPVMESVAALEWVGPSSLEAFAEMCRRLEADDIERRVLSLAARRGGG